MSNEQSPIEASTPPPTESSTDEKKSNDETHNEDDDVDALQPQPPPKKEEVGETKKEEEIKLERLQKPIFDSSLIKRNDGTISGSLLSINSEEPFLCTPLPMTESNLLSWLMRGKKTRRTRRTADNTSQSSSRKRNKWNDRLPAKFVEGERLRYATEEAKELRQKMKDYHNRREYNRILASRMELGTATIDEHGRLLPIPHPDAPAADMHDDNNRNRDVNVAGAGAGAGGEGGRGDHIQQNQRQQLRNNFNDNNNNNQNRNEFFDENMDVNDRNRDDRQDEEEEEDDDPGLFNAVFGIAAQEWLDEEEERMRILDQQEMDAEDAIAIAVEKYRNEGVPEEDFIFVHIPTRSKFSYLHCTLPPWIIICLKSSRK